MTTERFFEIEEDVTGIIYNSFLKAINTSFSDFALLHQMIIIFSLIKLINWQGFSPVGSLARTLRNQYWCKKVCTNLKYPMQDNVTGLL